MKLKQVLQKRFDEFMMKKIFPDKEDRNKIWIHWSQIDKLTDKSIPVGKVGSIYSIYIDPVRHSKVFHEYLILIEHVSESEYILKIHLSENLFDKFKFNSFDEFKDFIVRVPYEFPKYVTHFYRTIYI